MAPSLSHLTSKTSAKEWGIKLFFSTPRYPKANGQVELANKIVIKIIKKQLKKAKGLWADELLGVLRSYRTTAHTSTGETPPLHLALRLFSPAYGTEVVLFIECGIPSARYLSLDEDTNR